MNVVFGAIDENNPSYIGGAGDDILQSVGARTHSRRWRRDERFTSEAPGTRDTFVFPAGERDETMSSVRIWPRICNRLLMVSHARISSFLRYGNGRQIYSADGKDFLRWRGCERGVNDGRYYLHRHGRQPDRCRSEPLTVAGRARRRRNVVGSATGGQPHHGRMPATTSSTRSMATILISPSGTAANLQWQAALAAGHFRLPPGERASERDRRFRPDAG